MPRVRISTTVDAGQWEQSRKLLKLPASKIVDRALQALLEQLEAQRDLDALESFPYEQDPDLSWSAPSQDALPYDGAIPAEVLRLAAKRRRSKKK